LGRVTRAVPPQVQLKGPPWPLVRPGVPGPFRGPGPLQPQTSPLAVRVARPLGADPPRFPQVLEIWPPWLWRPCGSRPSGRKCFLGMGLLGPYGRPASRCPPSVRRMADTRPRPACVRWCGGVNFPPFPAFLSPRPLVPGPRSRATGAPRSQAAPSRPTKHASPAVLYLVFFIAHDFLLQLSSRKPRDI